MKLRRCPKMYNNNSFLIKYIFYNKEYYNTKMHTAGKMVKNELYFK